MKAEDSRQADTQTEDSARIPEGAGLGAEIYVTTRPRTKAEWVQDDGGGLVPYSMPIRDENRVFLQLQRLNSPALRGCIAQRPVE